MLDHLRTVIRGVAISATLFSLFAVANQNLVFGVDCDILSFQNPRDFAVGGVWVHAAQAGDFNNDHKLDLAVVVESTHTVKILLGDGNGHFPTQVSLNVGLNPFSNVIADFDGDGNADVATISFLEGKVYVHLGNGAGAFSGPFVSDAGNRPVGLTAADFNGDGKVDLAITSEPDQNVAVILGSGTGTFATPLKFPVGSGSKNIASGDLDHDGKVDLVTSNTQNCTVAIFYGLGTGAFSPGPFIPVGIREPSEPLLADVDGNGDLDIVATDRNREFGLFGSQVTVLLGDGNRHFSIVTSSSGRSSNDRLRAIDMDGDGILDLVSESGQFSEGYLDVRLGNGDGSFDTPLSYPSRGNPHDVVVGDFNADGKPDLVSANYFDASVSIFINDGLGDRTPPKLSVADLTLNATGPNGTVVNYTVSASDASGTTVNCTVASGALFPVGTTPVTCNAVDACGNAATASFNVTVNPLFPFSGFFHPVDNIPVVNLVQAGQAIPIKFSLGGNRGLNIFAPGYPVSFPVVCDTEDMTNDIEETLTAGSSSLSYDHGTDRYLYVWKTNEGWSNSCRIFSVLLTDGSEHRAYFRFKK